MKNKISVTRILMRGEKTWQVRWRDKENKRRRKFFSSEAAAEAEAAKLRGQFVSAEKDFRTLPSGDRETMLYAWREAERRGIDLLALLAGTADTPALAGSPALMDVHKEMDEAKRKAGKKDRYLKSLAQIVTKFAKGRERMPINKITLEDIEKFLDSKNIRSRSTLRARLASLFKFAVRRGYRPDCPTDRLEPITMPNQTPQTMTFTEMEKALAWLTLNPRSLAWFALSAFAGLRPEEAEKTTWKDINFAEGWIRVEAQTSKVGQRRVVYPLPTAIAWLQQAKELGAELPLGRKARKLDRIALRAELNWPVWKQDVTRHTAASNWLAVSRSSADVAESLGHSEKILKKHYKALITKAEAEKFWNLIPVTTPAKATKAAKPAKPAKAAKAAKPA